MKGKIKIIILIVLIFFIIGSVSTYFIFLRLQGKTNYELEIIIGTSSNNSYEIFLPIPLESEDGDVSNEIINTLKISVETGNCSIIVSEKDCAIKVSGTGNLTLMSSGKLITTGSYRLSLQNSTEYVFNGNTSFFVKYNNSNSYQPIEIKMSCRMYDSYHFSRKTIIQGVIDKKGWNEIEGFEEEILLD